MDGIMLDVRWSQCSILLSFDDTQLLWLRYYSIIYLLLARGVYRNFSRSIVSTITGLLLQKRSIRQDGRHCAGRHCARGQHIVLCCIAQFRTWYAYIVSVCVLSVQYVYCQSSRYVVNTEGLLLHSVRYGRMDANMHYGSLYKLGRPRRSK